MNASGTQNDAATLRAGVAKVDITTESGLRVNDPLYARVLVLDNDSTRVVLVSMDTTAIAGRTVSAGFLPDVADDFMEQLRRHVSDKLKISGCNITVTATHTHPPSPMLCSDDEQLKRIGNAIAQAIENLTPVKIAIGRGHEDRLTINRNAVMKDGSHWAIRMWEPCPPDDEIASVGPIDPEIGILRLDRLDGSPLAVVYNFACHLGLGVPLYEPRIDTPGADAVSAGFSGFASNLIEQQLGDDVMAMYIQGANGDLAEAIDKDFHRPRSCEEFGMNLGVSTLKALKEMGSGGHGELKFVSRTIELPRRTDIPQVIAKLEEEQEQLCESLNYNVLNFKTFLPLYMKYMVSPQYPSASAYRYIQEQNVGARDIRSMDACNKRDVDKYMANIKAMERLSSIRDKLYTLRKHKKVNDDSGETTIAAEIHGIRIGDCVFIGAPIELICEIGLKIKEKSPFKQTFVASDTNGYMHYGVTPEYYAGGGYEATECLLAPEWLPMFETTVEEIFEQLK
jgi:hypothetical protein